MRESLLQSDRSIERREEFGAVTQAYLEKSLVQ